MDRGPGRDDDGGHHLRLPGQPAPHDEAQLHGSRPTGGRGCHRASGVCQRFANLFVSTKHMLCIQYICICGYAEFISTNICIC